MAIDPENAIEAAPVTQRAAAWLEQSQQQLDAVVRLGATAKNLAAAYVTLREDLTPAMQAKTGMAIATAISAKESAVVEAWAVAQAIYADSTGQTDAEVAAKVAATVAAIRAAQAGE